jgi:hypothetical protein
MNISAIVLAGIATSGVLAIDGGVHHILAVTPAVYGYLKYNVYRKAHR